MSYQQISNTWFSHPSKTCIQTNLTISIKPRRCERNPSCYGLILLRPFNHSIKYLRFAVSPRGPVCCDQFLTIRSCPARAPKCEYGMQLSSVHTDGKLGAHIASVMRSLTWLRTGTVERKPQPAKDSSVERKPQLAKDSSVERKPQLAKDSSSSHEGSQRHSWTEASTTNNFITQKHQEEIVAVNTKICEIIHFV